jgi:ABC-type transport system substrate-binding protein
LNRKRNSFFILSAVFLLALALSMTSAPATASTTGYRDPWSDKEPVWDNTIGFADEIYFRVIEGDEQNVLALQAGDVELIGQFIEPQYLAGLQSDPNVELNMTNRKGFGHVTLNCDSYPTNYTELRQSFAYALDKDLIQERAFQGLSRPADSVIPPSMGAWSLDNDPWSSINNYYDPDPIAGNALLGDLDPAGAVGTNYDGNHWADLTGDGYREDPNGEEFVLDLHGSTGSSIVTTVLEACLEAFESLHIRATWQTGDFNALMALHDQGRTNLVFYAWNTPGVDPLFLTNLRSTDANNRAFWYNTTYDDLMVTALTSSDLATVKDAVLNAQKILWYEQPIVVCYMNLYPSAYRSDPWTGWVNTEGSGVSASSGLTWGKVQLKPEYGAAYGEQYEKYRQGGRFTMSLPQAMGATNYLTSPGGQSAYTAMCLALVYDGIYNRNPYSLEDAMGVAKDWSIEEVNMSDPDVATDHPRAVAGDQQKITFNLHTGFTFHDGQPLTADDVAYAYELINRSQSPIYLDSIEPVTHVEVVDSTTVEVYCDTPSIFNFHRAPGNWVVWPKHIWENVANPLTWENPTPIGSGSYKWKSRTPGELVVIERNDDYFYNARNYRYFALEAEETTTETTTGTETSVETTTPPPATPGFELLALLASFAAIVIIERKRKR